MTTEFFDGTLADLLSRRPFQVFAIELLNGRRFEVDHPSVIAVREGRGVVILPGSVPVSFDHTSVAAILHAGSSAAA